MERLQYSFTIKNKWQAHIQTPRKYTDKHTEISFSISKGSSSGKRSRSTLDEQQLRWHTVKTERGSEGTQRKMRIKSRDIDQGMRGPHGTERSPKCCTLVVAVFLSIAVLEG